MGGVIGEGNACYHGSVVYDPNKLTNKCGVVILGVENSMIQGHWLKVALDAQKVTPYVAAKRMDNSGRADKIYNHISNKFHLSAESIAKLAHAFPTLNVRYVLTGEGSPIS